MSSEHVPLPSQADFDRWWSLYHLEVLADIRQNLRARTRIALSTSVSSIAQAVWTSFIERHGHEVDPRSDASAWKVLFEAAGPQFVRGLVPKHWDTANRISAPDRPRGRKVSLEDLGQPNPDGDKQDIDIADHRELPPSLAAECADVLFRLTPGLGKESGRRTPYDQFIEMLDEEERFVFSLRLAGQSLPEIAQHPEATQLGIDETYADHLWERIKLKAAEQRRQMPA